MDVRRNRKHVLALAILGLALSPHLVVGQAAGPPAESAARLLVVVRPASLFQETAAGLSASATLPSGTLAAALSSDASGHYWKVRLVSQPTSAGWIAKQDAQPFASTAANLVRRGSETAVRGEPAVPDLIRLQNQPAYEQAWLEIEAAMAENAKLPEPLSEPYFARAEIWMAVDNYEGAVADYVQALALARKPGRDLAAYQTYLLRLQEALDRRAKAPRPPTLGNHETHLAASRQHFDSGYHAFWQGDLETARLHFDSALQLQPDEALYWYYRALTWKRLGDAEKAQHDALYGAYMERHCGSRWYRAAVGAHLTRLQGELRRWLEEYRLGDPSHNLIRSTLNTTAGQ